MKKLILLEKFINSLLEADPNFQDLGTRKVSKKNSNNLPQTAQLPQAFNFNQFKQIQNPIQRWEFAKNTLKSLGSGSGREVFQLSNNLALKVPVGQNPASINNGQKQNKAELGRCSAEPEHNKFLAKVHADQSDEVDGNWLVVDLAQPVNEKGFQSLTGIEWETFIGALEGIYHKDADDQKKHDAQVLSKNKFFQAMLNTINSCHLVASDVASINNWGNINNQAVLIDYGYTRELTNKIQTVRVA